MYVDSQIRIFFGGGADTPVSQVLQHGVRRLARLGTVGADLSSAKAFFDCLEGRHTRPPCTRFLSVPLAGVTARVSVSVNVSVGVCV